MVDRFMGILVSDDPDVGLNLYFDEISLCYSCNKQGENIYNEILLLIGEAFLLRKDKKACKDGELSKVVGTEIPNQATQKNLILKNERIPGLLEKISQYKELVGTAGAKTPPNDDKDGGSNGEGADDNGTSCDGNDSADREDPNKDSETDSNGSTNGDDEFVPNKKFQPKKGTREFLTFTQTEAKNFKISGTSDYEEKIKSLIWDLSKLSVNNHPYACAMLYRSLLEVCTKLVYHRYIPSSTRTYNESDLTVNMIHLVNNVLFKNVTTKDVPKTRDTVRDRLSKPNLIDTLNLYIHYPTPVDEQNLLSSWNTMKFYLIACLEM